jgi:hypothetical protein
MSWLLHPLISTALLPAYDCNYTVRVWDRTSDDYSRIDDVGALAATNGAWSGKALLSPPPGVSNWSRYEINAKPGQVERDPTPCSW